LHTRKCECGHEADGTWSRCPACAAAEAGLVALQCPACRHTWLSAERAEPCPDAACHGWGVVDAEPPAVDPADLRSRW
jgi:hypothetical protein